MLRRHRSDPPNRAFSAGGDSGSFIIDRDTLAPYALLYGGGPDSLGIDRTLAQFMPDVLKVPPRYGIRGIPTLMLFKNGEVEATKVGALSKSQLAAFLDSNI